MYYTMDNALRSQGRLWFWRNMGQGINHLHMMAYGRVGLQPASVSYKQPLHIT